MSATRVLACSLIVLASVSTTFTRAEQGRVELGVDVGVAAMDNEIGGSGSLYSIRFAYHATPKWDVELQALQATTDCPGDACDDLQMILIDGVRSFATTERLRPYALFGVGYTDFEYDNGALVLPGFGARVEDDIVYQAGVGLRVNFGSGKRTAIRGELSGTFLSDYQHANAQLGVVWQLGRAR